MGVTGLWTVVQPCARPIKLETLNKKRLAVDASIWIYQFLKAVRDKEGNALRNSHVVGFFRRICKLLFFGIKPVFVFDGGAPILKRQTVSSRKARREGRRDDAVRTAGKLLAVQMQRRAEEDEQKRREEHDQSRHDDQEEEIPDNPVYVDELQMTTQERVQNRTFKKKDAYHLPNLDVDISNLGAPNDPRIMSHEELEEYARQFHSGEDVAMYDFSKIDFDSTFFTSLPATDRYNILNAARLRSRLRMGYSKEQLDIMFPNRMDFSRFQIDRVKERNELTQRLMNLNGMNGEEAQFDQSARVAGEKGKEYVLVKNDGVEGGWALGVVTNRGEGEKNKPIDVEHFDKREQDLDDVDGELEEEGFEDVPIEGLNRLPARFKRPVMDTEDLPFDSQDAALRRRRIYEARLERAGHRDRSPQGVSGEQNDDDLFVAQDEASEGQGSELDEFFEDVPPPAEVEEDDLQRAIALSLEQDEGGNDDTTGMPSFANAAVAGPRTDQPLQFDAKNAKVGRDFAHLTNARAQGVAPKPFGEDSDDGEFDLQTGLAESRQGKRKPTTGPRVHGFTRPDTQRSLPSQKDEHGVQPSGRAEASVSAFDGPLPFESINLGSSILGRKKGKSAQEAEGGFEKDDSGGRTNQPLPPWFAGDVRQDVAKQNVIERQQDQPVQHAQRSPPLADDHILTKDASAEVIDLEGPRHSNDDIISIQSSDEGEPDDMIVGKSRPVDREIRMTDVADLTRAEPPILVNNPTINEPSVPVETNSGEKELDQIVERYGDDHSEPRLIPSSVQSMQDGTRVSSDQGMEDNEIIAWSESDHDEDNLTKRSNSTTSTPSESHEEQQDESRPQERSPFVDRGQSSTEIASAFGPPNPAFDDNRPQSPAPLLKQESTADLPLFDGEELEAEQTYSDPEDEDLMRQLAGEAEEHARFASSLNAKSYLQNAEEYERELRQLRNQQKKDRRDADEVTHIMITECQQLLRLFGLPYITAPMEAEAQCAELVSLGLVDGIVTDDSDCFLFGGNRIYKNFFNQSKFVECYLTSDLEKEYGLTREKLIRFAHLLGSDYTEGLPSVGPVTALEIISEFETLEKFAEWWSAVQMAALPASEDSASPFRKKFRKNASKIFLPNTFPDTRVDQAYLNPEVDNDPQAFQWGVPDLDALRSFLMATIGWSQERTDEVLVPVIKDMNRRETEGTQANITQFFGGSVGVGARQQPRPNENGGGDSHFAPRRRADGKSSRMANALGKLQKRAQGKEGDADGDVVDSQARAVTDRSRTSGARKRARKRPVIEDDEDDGHANGTDEVDDDDDFAAPKVARKKGRKKGKTSV